MGRGGSDPLPTLLQNSGRPQFWTTKIFFGASRRQKKKPGMVSCGLNNKKSYGQQEKLFIPRKRKQFSPKIGQKTFAVFRPAKFFVTLKFA